MGTCQRIKVDRVFYDQAQTLNDVVVENNRIITATPVIEDGDVFRPADVASIQVEVTSTGCFFNFDAQEVIVNFDIIKTLNFVDPENPEIIIDTMEFSFVSGDVTINLPKFQDTNIPPEFIPRLKCQVFDFTPFEDFDYTPAIVNENGVITTNARLTDTLDVRLVLKIAAEDQIFVKLCPESMTRVVVATPNNG